MLAFRTFAWMFMSVVPVSMTTHALAYGPQTGVGFGIEIAMGALCIGAAGGILLDSINDG